MSLTPVPPGIITLSGLSVVYNGSPQSITASASDGSSVSVTYNGSSTPPTNAGNYYVVATSVLEGVTITASAQFYITPAPATITLSGAMTVTYDGSSHGVTATTTPSGLTTSITYNGSTTPPTNSGSYTVEAIIVSSNYVGSISETLIIKGQVYYYNNATSDANLLTLGNWWNNSSHTTAATSLPTAYDTVYIDGLVNVLRSEGSTIVAYDTVIIGKYSTNLQLYPGGPDQYGWGQNVTCNHFEMWNGASFYLSASPNSIAFGGSVSSTFHYPCPLPILHLAGYANAFSSPNIEYIGYPYAIAQTASDLAVQQLWIDKTNHGTAQWGQQPVNNGQPSWNVTQTSISPGTLKEGDDFLFQVAFHAGSSFLDPQITMIFCTFLDPASRSVVLSSANFIPCVVTSWGDPSFFSYLLYFPITSPALSKCFGSFADGVIETVTLIGEIAWQEVNQTGVGPSLINRRSQNFPVTITRSLNQEADFTS